MTENNGMKRDSVNELRDKGIENLTLQELSKLVRNLYDKRDRTHIRDYVSHKVLDSASLQERCQLIIDGLADKFSDKADGYKFGFDEIGLYLPRENGDLESIASKGPLPQIIRSDDKITSYKEHFAFGESFTEYYEIVIPLVANNVYQGSILIRKKESIDFKELYNFFYAYGDMAAEAIYSAKIYEALVKEHERVNKLLTNLKGVIYDVVHGFKNRLVSIGGFARMLLARDYDKEKQTEFLNIIRIDTDLMETSTRGLLDFLRLEAEYEPRIKDYNLNKAITRDIIKRLETRAKEENIVILYSADKSTETIKTDPGLLNSVLENLLVNAISHGEKGTVEQPKEVNISAEKREEGVYIRVVNDGYIRDIQKCFEPFYTFDKERGTGLGLDIARRNTELLGGRVTANNIKEKDISRVCFEIYLPQNI